ncbi:MAG: hypothetical protein M1832_002412 [Thelocarpon impressellum]|nr:MAG: hypothetical protein M1832_002412 [Thelocarpon impressellum]
MVRPQSQRVADLGRHIYVYNNLRTNQVVYSLSRTLKNNDSLSQLPYLGKKTVPASLRKDLWQPMASISFPKPPQGLKAYTKLREYRRLHELSYPVEDFQSETNPHAVMPKKKRGRKLMDQKANSVADIAAVLKQQEEEGREAIEELAKARDALKMAHEQASKTQLAKQKRERDARLGAVEDTMANADRRRTSRRQEWLERQQEATRALMEVHEMEARTLPGQQKNEMDALLEKQRVAREQIKGSPPPDMLAAQEQDRTALTQSHDHTKTAMQERHARESSLSSTRLSELRTAMQQVATNLPAPPTPAPSSTSTPFKESEDAVLARQSAAREALAATQASEVDLLARTGRKSWTLLQRAVTRARLILPARHAHAMQLLLRTQRNAHSAASPEARAALTSTHASELQSLAEQQLRAEHAVLSGAVGAIFARRGGAVSPVGPPVIGEQAVRISWASVLDAEMAPAWPDGVVHDGMAEGRYTAPEAPSVLDEGAGLDEAGHDGGKEEKSREKGKGGLGWLRSRLGSGEGAREREIAA